jgi:hypothetical protein
MVGWM